eukprot:5809147-Alexandrium_andersonii.AAC.1
MSASLVGSEMCIRDRPLTFAASPAPGPASRAVARPRPRRAVAAPQLDGPVSYTHLTLPTICSV